MEELYSIMRELLEIKYHQESLVCLLNAADMAYSDPKQTEARFIANSVKFYLRKLQEELNTTIHKIDLYIIENSKK